MFIIIVVVVILPAAATTTVLSSIRPNKLFFALSCYVLHYTRAHSFKHTVSHFYCIMYKPLFLERFVIMLFFLFFLVKIVLPAFCPTEDQKSYVQMPDFSYLCFRIGLLYLTGTGSARSDTCFSSKPGFLSVKCTISRMTGQSLCSRTLSV